MHTSFDPWSPNNWSASLDTSDLPPVTIGVLTYNRRVDLRRTLDVLTCGIIYNNATILVVDNGSTDGTVEMIEEEFPSVQIHKVGCNIGTPARNFLFDQATGKYLFCYDDDSFPASPATIRHVVEYLETHTDVDLLSTLCYQPVSKITETAGWQKYSFKTRGSGYEGIFVVEGGSCFRLDRISDLRYDFRFTYGAEGMELGIQLYKNNRCIRLCPSFGTIHFPSLINRPKGFRTYGNSRHIIWMIVKHWPTVGAIPLLIAFLLRKAIAVIMRPSTARQSLKGLIDGFRGIPEFKKFNPKLTPKQSLSILKFYFFLFRWG